MVSLSLLFLTSKWCGLEWVIFNLSAGPGHSMDFSIWSLTCRSCRQGIFLVLLTFLIIFSLLFLASLLSQMLGPLSSVFNFLTFSLNFSFIFLFCILTFSVKFLRDFFFFFLKDHVLVLWLLYNNRKSPHHSEETIFFPYSFLLLVALFLFPFCFPPVLGLGLPFKFKDWLKCLFISGCVSLFKRH